MGHVVHGVKLFIVLCMWVHLVHFTIVERGRGDEIQFLSRVGVVSICLVRARQSSGECVLERIDHGRSVQFEVIMGFDSIVKQWKKRFGRGGGRVCGGKQA